MLRGDVSDPESAPASVVFVETFAIDRTEVTVERYRNCVALGDCTLPAGELSLAYYRSDSNLLRPMAGLTLEQMEDYCETRGRHLPTEAQWERAARGLDGRGAPWGDGPPPCGGVNAGGCETGPAQVGERELDRTFEGVLDLFGNVAEATSDRWEDGGYLGYTDMECNPAHPTRTPEDATYVMRGCSWRADPDITCSGTLRRPAQRFAGADDVGFRCASSR